MSRWIDLHMHSTASDGAYPPARLMEMAHLRGLSAVSLTDHDTTAGLNEASTAAAALGMEFVPGIELAARRERGVLHLLGYFIDGTSDGLKAFTVDARHRRAERAGEILKRLQALGIAIDESDLGPRAAVDGANITRSHIAAALVRRGAAHGHIDAFNRFLADGRPAFVPAELASAAEAISAIRSAGGIASLAHPSQLACGSDLELETLVRSLRDAGLGAIETSHPDMSPRLRKVCEELAGRFGMARTGGSDFHAFAGPAGRGTGFGSDKVPYAWLESLRAAANR